MAQFSYRARRRSGEVVQGVLDVADRSAALVQIERLGLFPVMVDGSKSATAAAAATERAERNGNGNGQSSSLMPAAIRGLRRKRKPKLQELATFTQQLANLLK